MATAYKILKNTAKAGNSIIGAGVYSAVLQHGAPALGKVIKIANTTQDPWLDYYDYIVAPNKANPHVPNVDKVYVDHYHEYYVANMEELSPYAWDFDEDAEDGFDRAGLAESISELIKDEITEEEFADTWVEFEQDVFPEGFKQFFQITRQLRDQTDVKCEDDHSWNSQPDEETRKLDLHAGNIMFRNNTVVITDPWCNLAVDEHPSMETYVEESNDKNIESHYSI